MLGEVNETIIMLQKNGVMLFTSDLWRSIAHHPGLHFPGIYNAPLSVGFVKNGKGVVIADRVHTLSYSRLQIAMEAELVATTRQLGLLKEGYSKARDNLRAEQSVSVEEKIIVQLCAFVRDGNSFTSQVHFFIGLWHFFFLSAWLRQISLTVCHMPRK